MYYDAFLYYEGHLYLNFGSSRLFRFLRYRADESNPRYQKIKAMASTRASAQPEFLVQRLLIQKRQAFKGKVEMNILEFYNNAEENVN